MRNIKLLIAFIRGNIVFYIAAMTSLCLASFCAILIPGVIKNTIDNILGGNPGEAVLFLEPFFKMSNLNPLIMTLIALVSLTLVQGIFQFCRTKFTSIASENSRRNMQDRLFSHFMHLPFGYHTKAQAGDLIQRATSDVDTVFNFVSGQLVEIINILASIILTFCIMLTMNVKYTIISSIFMPVLILYAFKFFGSMQQVFKEADEKEAAMTIFIQENLTGVRVVKAFGTHNSEIVKFNELSDGLSEKFKEITKILATFWSVSDMFCALQLAIVLIAGVLFASKGELSVGTIVAFSTYTSMLIWPTRGFGRILASMGQTFVSLRRIDEVLSEPIEEDEENNEIIKIHGEIEFKNVSFGYGTQNPVLNELSFSIKKGQTCAILGSTGSGKSTLVQLLLRLYDYQKGSITIDGIELRKIPRKELRRQIGIVLQEPFLFSKTMFDNIKMGKEDATEQMVEDSCKIAAIHDTIQGFDKGYETIVGERGVTLSGGQRQRTAIARSIIKDIPILIFDDSLSAVDMETDAKIRAALKERSRDTTTIIISHRITTLAEADKIFVLGDGKIQQSGTHEELIKCEGLYRRIWDIQASLEEDIL